MNKRLLLIIIPIVILPLSADQYIPIVLLHGIVSDAYYMKPIEQHIRTYMGDEKMVYIHNINLGDGQLTSLSALQDQVDYFNKIIKADPLLTHGFNIIAHSQGGLIARAYIEQYNNPKVITYIAWGSPQQGVFGLPGDFDKRFAWLDYIEQYAHSIIYSRLFQNYVGFAGYWHDPIHYTYYSNRCTFLPYLNNEIDHPKAALFKKNITSLHQMVIVMTTIDDVIEPRESCHFGFYQNGSKTELVSVFDTDFYKNDRLGIKTLYESGRLHLGIAHCSHTDFQKDKQNFLNNGLEYLKMRP